MKKSKISIVMVVLVSLCLSFVAVVEAGGVTTETSYMLRDQKIIRRRTVYPSSSSLSSSSSHYSTSNKISKKNDPSIVDDPPKLQTKELQEDDGKGRQYHSKEERSKNQDIVEDDNYYPSVSTLSSEITNTNMINLQGMNDHYFNKNNETTLFDMLYHGPYEIYEHIVGDLGRRNKEPQKLKYDESKLFPIFSIPMWNEEIATTSARYVFSAFSKFGHPIIFETTRILLNPIDIENIIMATDTTTTTKTTTATTQQFITDFNLHSSLLIVKVLQQPQHPLQQSQQTQNGGENFGPTTFLGLVFSYCQPDGFKTNVMVPLGRLDDFHITEQSPKTTKNVEIQALDEYLEQIQTNRTNDYFHHPDNRGFVVVDPTIQQRQQQEHEPNRRHLFMDFSNDDYDDDEDELESRIRYYLQKLYFQLLIQRSSLFSYGYADCLMASRKGLNDDNKQVIINSNDLLQCLDDVFYNIIKIETNIGGAIVDGDNNDYNRDTGSMAKKYI